jgi:hypothetical protein
VKGPKDRTPARASSSGAVLQKLVSQIAEFAVTLQTVNFVHSFVSQNSLYRLPLLAHHI